MAEQPLAPQFIDADEREAPPARLVQPIQRGSGSEAAVARPAIKKRGFLATIDTFVLIGVLMMLAIGALMIYSTTFDWSYQEFGVETAILMQHVRNIAIGAVVMVVLAVIDYRIWKRFAVLLLLLTIGSLIAVLLFSDQVFGARRSFLNGSYQPGELAELTIVIYLAAWMSSKKRGMASFFNGLLPFAVLIGLVGGLILLQPDLSTAATIFITAGLMYFLAGANLMHLGIVLSVMGGAGFLLSQRLGYAQGRVSTYIAGLTDLTQTNYHAQQAIIAFLNGGWTGVGLGQGRQKFGFLPAPHTDSIFAVIGEELGVLGAGFIVLLFVLVIVRGLQVARRCANPFGALLAAGITLWIATKALMNIAVMINLLPATGVALPFISFGGSSLVTAMAGAGILLSVSRVTAIGNMPEGRSARADHDRGWGNRWSRVPGSSGRRSAAPTASRH